MKIISGSFEEKLSRTLCGIRFAEIKLLPWDVRGAFWFNRFLYTEDEV